MPELLARYREAWRHAWARRAELAGPRRLSDEAAFLPAAGSLRESPLHPAPRRVAGAIVLLFVIALTWAVLGHVDVVAVASGRIVVSERTKVVQPLERSVVRRVLVADGDHVGLGQPLVELDATDAMADVAGVRDMLQAAESELLRAQSLSAGLGRVHATSADVRVPTTAPALDMTTASAWTAAERAQAGLQLATEWRDITARLERAASEIARRHAEAATVHAMVGKLEATLPLARQREADFARLAEQGFMSTHANQDRTRERIEIERDLATQRARLAETQAALRESINNRIALVAENRRTLTEREAAADLKRQQALQAQSKAERRERLTTLRSPVDGTVQQLAVHTQGGVVTEAQALMVIVPDDAPVIAEVVLDNKDVGFVRAAQQATIKLETFPYTRYGTVQARVRTVSSDAVADEKRGAVFPVTLALEKESVDVEGRAVRLGPGMNLTAEIRTGNRRVIDYLLSPVREALGESLRER